MIGKTLTVHGHLSGREDLVIDGRVEGDIELFENRLTIGAGGHVQGGVKAREIAVFGTVNGNLEASERIEIKKNAKVIGDLRSARFIIEDEAYFKGNIDTIRPEQKPAEVKPSVVKPAATVTSAAATADGTLPAQPSYAPGAGTREIKR